MRYRGTAKEKIQKQRGGGTQPPPTVFNSRRLLAKSAKATLDTDSDDSDDEEARKRIDGFMPVKGEPGLYYKVRLTAVKKVLTFLYKKYIYSVALFSSTILLFQLQCDQFNYSVAETLKISKIT